MDLYLKILIGIACIITMFLSLLGNGLVISVILRYKRLKNSTNYILLSLAIADLTVSILVMLPAMTQDVLNRWIFSKLFCKFYNAFDVTCCTASILHLLLVAIDRYIAIFKPLTYKNVVRKWHVFVMVVSIWTLSLCMSFIPIFLGWNMLGQNRTHSDTLSLVNFTFETNNTLLAYTSSSSSSSSISSNSSNELCILQANVAFSLISSSLSFYIPLIIMICVYFRIYIVAKRQAKSIAQIQYNSRYFNNNNNNSTNNNTAINNTINNANVSNNPDEILNNKEINQILLQNGEYRVSEDKNDKSSRIFKVLKSLKNIEKKRTRDTKAVKTVGIIMGIFILCWLPFFIMYCTMPIIQLYDPSYKTPYFVERIITWIGYVNSFVNPIVYALTYRDFRKAYIATLKAIAKKFCPVKSIFHDEKHAYFDESNFKSNKMMRRRQCQQKQHDETLCTKFFNSCCCFSNISSLMPTNSKLNQKFDCTTKQNGHSNTNLENNNINKINNNNTTKEEGETLSLLMNNYRNGGELNINSIDSLKKNNESLIIKDANKTPLILKRFDQIGYDRRSLSLDLSISSSSLDRYSDELKNSISVEKNESTKKKSNNFKSNSRIQKYFSVKITKKEMMSSRNKPCNNEKLSINSDYNNNNNNIVKEIEVCRV